VTGQDRFRRALKRLSQRTGHEPLPDQGELPKASSAWEAWMEYRLERIETQQTWLSRVILGALAMQVGLQVLGMLR
jgi:uncharacterized protein YjiS (DUF1127 family)